MIGLGATLVVGWLGSLPVGAEVLPWNVRRVSILEGLRSCGLASSFSSEFEDELWRAAYREASSVFDQQESKLFCDSFHARLPLRPDIHDICRQPKTHHASLRQVVRRKEIPRPERALLVQYLFPVSAAVYLLSTSSRSISTECGFCNRIGHPCLTYPRERYTSLARWKSQDPIVALQTQRTNSVEHGSGYASHSPYSNTIPV
jgi:hypothetical protein